MIKALAKPTFQRSLAADLKRFDKDVKAVHAEVAAKQLTRKKASRSLALLARARRETTRLMSSTRETVRQALATIDRDIKRVAKEG